MFSLSTRYFTTADWSLTMQTKQSERNVVFGWAGICGEGLKTLGIHRGSFAFFCFRVMKVVQLLRCLTSTGVLLEMQMKSKTSKKCIYIIYNQYFLITRQPSFFSFWEQASTNFNNIKIFLLGSFFCCLVVYTLPFLGNFLESRKPHIPYHPGQCAEPIMGLEGKTDY